MAKLQVKGLNEYTKSIQKLYKDSEVIMKRSIYPAAGFVVDNMKRRYRVFRSRKDHRDFHHMGQ